METFGSRIKKRRTELGLSQAALGERLGYTSRAAICRLEKNVNGVPLAQLPILAKALNTTEAYLLGLPESPSDKSIKADASQVSKVSPGDTVHLTTKAVPQEGDIIAADVNGFSVIKPYEDGDQIIGKALSVEKSLV